MRVLLAPMEGSRFAGARIADLGKRLRSLHHRIFARGGSAAAGKIVSAPLPGAAAAEPHLFRHAGAGAAAGPAPAVAGGKRRPRGGTGLWGVDLNCGCPSKLVNGSGGGATLLKDPELIYRGAKAMREAVPDHLPVTVKVRLGWDSGDKRFEIADAVQQAGASELVVHGRTKEEGYRAECINWQAIGEIRQRLRIPVIANGEIWDWESAQQCMAQTGCDAVMIGRGALNVPNLSRVVKYNEPPMPPQVMALLHRYTRLEKQGDTGMYHVARIKQWLGYLRKAYPEADGLFTTVRTLKTSPEIAAAIDRHCEQAMV